MCTLDPVANSLQQQVRGLEIAENDQVVPMSKARTAMCYLLHGAGFQ